LTVGGTYGGFYANWLAWAECLLSLSLLSRYLKTGKSAPLALSILFSIAMLFTHPWFWDVYMAALFLCLVLILIRRRAFKKIPKKEETKGLLFILSGNALADLLKEVGYNMFGGLKQQLEYIA
ncbi:hypothetical protein DRN86_05810, partial [Candidatus Geothermarchaeota archaeon]